MTNSRRIILMKTMLNGPVQASEKVRLNIEEVKFRLRFIEELVKIVEGGFLNGF